MSEDAKAFGPAAQPSELLAEIETLRSIVRLDDKALARARAIYEKLLLGEAVPLDEVREAIAPRYSAVHGAQGDPATGPFKRRPPKQAADVVSTAGAGPSGNAEGAKALEIARAEGKAEGRRERDAEWREALREGMAKIGSSAIMYAPKLYDLFTAEYAANIAEAARIRSLIPAAPGGDSK